GADPLCGALSAQPRGAAASGGAGRWSRAGAGDAARAGAGTAAAGLAGGARHPFHRNRRMSFWALASGIIILGAGLGAPELPGMLERAGKLRGLDLSSSLVTQPPRLGATQPMLRAADDILLSPSAAADHW